MQADAVSKQICAPGEQTRLRLKLRGQEMYDPSVGHIQMDNAVGAYFVCSRYTKPLVHGEIYRNSSCPDCKYDTFWNTVQLPIFLFFLFSALNDKKRRLKTKVKAKPRKKGHNTGEPCYSCRCHCPGLILVGRGGL